MATKSSLSRLSIDIPKEEYKIFKAKAAITGLSMREIISRNIHEFIYGPHIPNEETKKAIEDSEKGIGLTYCKDIDDLFKKLGI